MTLSFWEWLSTALLVFPSLYTGLRLWGAYFAERNAAKEEHAAEGQFKSAEARRLAGAASLFPFWILLSFSAGLILQAIILIYKLCCA